MPTKVGKKVIRAAMAILDGPMPNQTIASGAGATIGTEADAMAVTTANAGNRLASAAIRTPPPQPSA